jgi:HAD superfamily hydrolase (TIGR01509 family)
VRVLLLDVMGTLVHDPFYEEMPRWFGLTFDELIAQKDPRAWVDFEHGAIDEATFAARFFADRRAVDGEVLRRKARESFRLLDGIEEVLDQLKGRGVEMHAFSNYPVWWRDVEAATGLSRWLEWSFVSCELGLRKPDPRVYREVVQRLAVEAERCVFVDDRERNVAAAREAGMVGVLFEGAGPLLESLLGGVL